MLLPSLGDMLPRILPGVQREAEARRWAFYPVVCRRDADGNVLLTRSPGGGTLSELLSLLHPDGAIVALNVVPREALSRAANESGAFRWDFPVVHLGEPMSPDFAVYAHGDADSFASLALRELLLSGFDDYAYVPSPLNEPWSRVRGKAFERYVTLSGRRFHTIAADSPPLGTAALADRLESWIATLPTSCGFFAANDITGEAVLRACARLGREVPGQTAVVGVDDIAYICDYTHPTLSSIRRDLEGEGRAAAELLAEWMERPDRPPPSRAVPAVSLVRRWSTRFSWQRDRRVARIQEWIRVHACEGIGPRDAVREMGVSRTTADRLFRTVAGHSILDEIHAVRLDRAKEKLRAGMAPDVVAAESGYTSTLDFRRVFRRRVGMPVVRWMKSV